MYAKNEKGKQKTNSKLSTLGFVLILSALIFSGCGPITAQPTPVPPTPTPIPHNPGVADIVRDPPPSGETVEVDAYSTGVGPVLSREGPIPRPDQVACPTWWALDAALSDRPFPAILVLLNVVTSNALPDDEPWLVATEPEAPRPGVRLSP